jgi:hypothetical protein
MRGLLGDVAQLLNPLPMATPVTTDVESDVLFSCESCNSAWYVNHGILVASKNFDMHRSVSFGISLAICSEKERIRNWNPVSDCW